MIPLYGPTKALNIVLCPYRLCHWEAHTAHYRHYWRKRKPRVVILSWKHWRQLHYYLTETQLSSDLKSLCYWIAYWDQSNTDRWLNLNICRLGIYECIDKLSDWLTAELLRSDSENFFGSGFMIASQWHAMAIKISLLIEAGAVVATPFTMNRLIFYCTLNNWKKEAILHAIL